MTTNVMPKTVSRIVAAFRAAQEMVTAVGGIFGNAVHSVKAFCNVLGESPANKLILSAFGSAVKVVRIFNNATNDAVDGFKNAVRGNDDLMPAHLLVPVPVYR
jgi:hypothetical protein